MAARARALLPSDVGHRYAEGHPEKGKRYDQGTKHIDVVESKTRDAMRKLFNVKNAEVRTYSAKELGRIGDRRGLRPLVWRAIHDADERVRAASIAAAKSIGDPNLLAPFVTAMWSSQAGSLLLWVWLLSLWSALVLFLTRKRLLDVTPYATAVLLGFGAFFSMLCVFFADPFATSANPSPEGMGLTPLLRHPMMMIHPPCRRYRAKLSAVRRSPVGGHSRSP